MSSYVALPFDIGACLPSAEGPFFQKAGPPIPTLPPALKGQALHGISISIGAGRKRAVVTTLVTVPKQGGSPHEAYAGRLAKRKGPRLKSGLSVGASKRPEVHG